MLFNAKAETLEELQMQALALHKREVLEKERHLLCTNLDPRSHYPYLRSRGVINCDEQERVHNCRSNESRAASTGLLLDIIATKSEGFTELCNSIEVDGTQMFLLEALNKSLEKAISQTNVLSGNIYTMPPIDVTNILPLPEPDTDDTLVNGDGGQNEDSVEETYAQSSVNNGLASSMSRLSTSDA